MLLQVNDPRIGAGASGGSVLGKHRAGGGGQDGKGQQYAGEWRGTGHARQNIHAGSPSGLREEVPVFFFYNSRWGCVTSLLVSAAVTLLLLYLLGWI
ncbi:hypothetical protein GCM10009642_61160 [Nocardiopsis metallicus]